MGSVIRKFWWEEVNCFGMGWNHPIRQAWRRSHWGIDPIVAMLLRLISLFFMVSIPIYGLPLLHSAAPRVQPPMVTELAIMFVLVFWVVVLILFCMTTLNFHIFFSRAVNEASRLLKVPRQNLANYDQLHLKMLAYRALVALAGEILATEQKAGGNALLGEDYANPLHGEWNQLKLKLKNAFNNLKQFGLITEKGYDIYFREARYPKF